LFVFRKFKKEKESPEIEQAAGSTIKTLLSQTGTINVFTLKRPVCFIWISVI
jgi:hypothetical protein